MTLFVSRLHLTSSVSSPHHSSHPNQDWNGWISLAQRLMFPMDVQNLGPIARASVVKSCITTHGTTDGNNIHLFPDVFATGVLITLMIIHRVMCLTARNIVFVFLVLYLRDYGDGWETESIVLIVASLLSDLKRTRGDACMEDQRFARRLTTSGRIERECHMDDVGGENGERVILTMRHTCPMRVGDRMRGLS
ncbi:hypothetical protein LB507_004096, partial [Fusarium sp. FIESC RH6]